MSIIKTISYSQDEILENIVNLHTGPIEAGVTFGKGCFYKKLPRPAFCFDTDPQRPGVVRADVCRLCFTGGRLGCPLAFRTADDTVGDEKG